MLNFDKFRKTEIVFYDVYLQFQYNIMHLGDIMHFIQSHTHCNVMRHMIQIDLNSRSQYRQMWKQRTDQETSLSSALTAFLQFQSMFKIRLLAQLCLSLPDSNFHQESEIKGSVHNSSLIPSHPPTESNYSHKTFCNQSNVHVSPAGKLVLMSKQNRVVLRAFPNKVAWCVVI